LRNAPALVILRILGAEVVLRLGNPPAQSRFYRLLWRHVINPLVSVFVCNSHFTQEELLSCGVPLRKVLQIYNTVPSRTASGSNSSRQDWRKLVFVGQLIPGKGVDVLMDAVGLLVQKGLDVKLDVVGDMERWEPPLFAGYRQRLIERAAEPDLAGRVNFLGYREDIPDVLAQAGIHCCPSQPELREGFGVVTVEAKMAGIPSVVTPTGALPELIRHGEDGWICSGVSAVALAEGIEKFLVDPALTSAAGVAALLSLERFDRKRFALRWWKIFSAQYLPTQAD
jgi:glycosyltransferase involved in cell wall biosynthesis